MNFRMTKLKSFQVCRYFSLSKIVASPLYLLCLQRFHQRKRTTTGVFNRNNTLIIFSDWRVTDQHWTGTSGADRAPPSPTARWPIRAQLLHPGTPVNRCVADGCFSAGECDGDCVPDELLSRDPAEGAAGGAAGPGRGQNTGTHTDRRMFAFTI